MWTILLLLFWASDCLLARPICSTLDNPHQHGSTNDIVSVKMVFVPGGQVRSNPAPTRAACETALNAGRCQVLRDRGIH